MKNKKIILTSILLILFVSVICGCNKEKKELSDSDNNINVGYNYLDEYKDKKIMNITSMTDVETNIADPKVLYDISDYIAIVKINSMDGANNFYKNTDVYTKTYTYGKATILKMIKGNINTKEINYMRKGGQMLYKDWVLGRPKESKEKALNLAKQNGLDINNTVVKEKEKDDIELEINKIYLVYMYHGDEYHDTNEYSIFGFQYGLREVNISSNTNTINSLDNIQVKDNNTNKWVSLSSLINFDVDK